VSIDVVLSENDIPTVIGRLSEGKYANIELILLCKQNKYNVLYSSDKYKFIQYIVFNNTRFEKTDLQITMNRHDIMVKHGQISYVYDPLL
jgi:hypothetical protein